MINKGRLLAFVLAAVLSLSAVIPTYASVTGRISGDDEIVDEATGYCWTEMEPDIWSCVDENGDPVQGWAKLNGVTYYMGKDGVMKTGWIKDKGKWYYLYEEDYLKKNKLATDLMGTLAVDTQIDNYTVGPTGAVIKIKQ